MQTKIVFDFVNLSEIYRVISLKNWIYMHPKAVGEKGWH